MFLVIFGCYGILNTYIVDAQIYQSKTFGIAVYIYQGLTLTQKQSY